MEKSIEICTQNLNLILKLIRELLKQIGDSPLARADREEFSAFEINYSNFNNRISPSVNNVEMAISSADGAAVHAQALGRLVSKRDIYPDDARLTAQELEEMAASFREIIASGKDFTAPYVLSIDKTVRADSASGDGSISSYEKNIIEFQAKTRSEIETFKRDITKGAEEIAQLKRKSFTDSQKALDDVSVLRGIVDDLKSDISNLQEQMHDEVGKAEKISEDAQSRSNEINSQINGLLGQTASKVLLVDYANTADTEKKSADNLRGWSLACMALTGIVLCIALYESLSSGLDWKQAIFKVFTAIALSVPAAYLARESAKHRNQEHTNRRISLDLRAITPYIASLPSEEQNKIKSEVASKIFGVQDSVGGQADNYPINIQEVVKMMIEKIPTPK